MGTSGASPGPGCGVPFDPPWLNDITPPKPSDQMQPNDQGNDDRNSGDNQPTIPSLPPARIPPLAPRKRFSNARRMLTDFARTGNRGPFRKAMGHYSRDGMGGAHNVAHRMRVATGSAANLFGFLQASRERTDPAITAWVKSLTSRNANAQTVVDEIIRRIAPRGGSADETSCRESMAQAMLDLLENNPDVDLLNLRGNDIWTLIESFLGHEAFNRLCLDIGQVFENSDFSPRDRVMRINEMQDYLNAELFAQIEKLRQTTPNADSSQLQIILQSALQNTFLVYEGAL